MQLTHLHHPQVGFLFFGGVGSGGALSALLTRASVSSLTAREGAPHFFFH